MNLAAIFAKRETEQFFSMMADEGGTVHRICCQASPTVSRTEQKLASAGVKLSKRTTEPSEVKKVKGEMQMGFPDMEIH